MATATKTKKSTEKKTTKKKYSYYEKQKVIQQISQETNRAITRRNLMDLALKNMKE